jgi:hypothetical protein
MSLEDNSEDEDYEAAATERVNEAISKDLDGRGRRNGSSACFCAA